MPNSVKVTYKVFRHPRFYFYFFFVFYLPLGTHEVFKLILVHVMKYNCLLPMGTWGEKPPTVYSSTYYKYNASSVP